MPYLGIFGLEFSKTIVIFEIDTLKFVYLQNFAKKQKCKNLRTKMLDFSNFGQEFQKVFVIFEISTLKYFKNEFSTRAVNSGIGSSFCKAPASAFSEGPGPGPGPLYKVCPPLRATQPL